MKESATDLQLWESLSNWEPNLDDPAPELEDVADPPTTLRGRWPSRKDEVVRLLKGFPPDQVEAVYLGLVPQPRQSEGEGPNLAIVRERWAHFRGEFWETAGSQLDDSELEILTHPDGDFSLPRFSYRRYWAFLSILEMGQGKRSEPPTESEVLKLLQSPDLRRQLISDYLQARKDVQIWAQAKTELKAPPRVWRPSEGGYGPDGLGIISTRPIGRVLTAALWGFGKWPPSDG